MAQTVSSAFTAEERDRTRSIGYNAQVSWHKDNILGNTTFTIGVSTIGGDDSIGPNSGGIGNPSQWRYFDESNYLLSLGWERELAIPTGGLVRANADAELDNTSGRFLPDYMRGLSEISTAILPRRPIILSAGFDLSGVVETPTVFSGLLKRQPQVNVRSRQVSLEAEDYVTYFDNKFLDRTALYTGVTTDEILRTFFLDSGMTTAQFDLDQGLNTIPFTILESGSKFSDIINELVQAENGHLFQDEEGIFRFWNRQHFDSAPYNQVQRILLTSQVIDAEAPNEDHIINVVEVTANLWEKRSNQTIFTLAEPVQVLAGIPKEIFVNMDDPILEVTGQTIAGNTQSDGSGSVITITLQSRYVFAQTVKYVVKASTNGYVTQLDVTGRSAVVGEELYLRTQDSSSVTAFEPRPLSINNRYIQDRVWAQSLPQVILDAYSEPENLQKITIRAIPELQLGDLISWQSRDWRIYGIRARLDPSGGFIQDLIVLKNTNDIYFQIGISTIGGDHAIAP